MEESAIIESIRTIATTHNLPPDIVYGVCKTESNLNPFAIRYEPAYRWLYHPKESKPTGCSLDTETVCQKISWGLMQVMGAVYRELGYKGWLSAVIADMNVHLDYGCRHLAKLIKRHGLSGGIAAYNAGSPRTGDDGTFVNQAYVDKVMGYAKEYRNNHESL